MHLSGLKVPSVSKSPSLVSRQSEVRLRGPTDVGHLSLCPSQFLLHERRPSVVDGNLL